MTLVQALAALLKTDKILTPWLPGMLWIRRDTPPELLRIVQGGIGAPAVWESMDYDGLPFDTEWVRCDEDDGWPFDSEPDITDTATVACLLALLREARGEPMLHLWAGTPKGYPMWDLNGLAHGYDTEGEAIAAGLIALASVPPA